MISTMYWATWVQVMARMPPRKEQTSTPPRPRKMPISKEAMLVSRVVIRPTP
jgi:hypothetical protein